MAYKTYDEQLKTLDEKIKTRRKSLLSRGVIILNKPRKGNSDRAFYRSLDYNLRVDFALQGIDDQYRRLQQKRRVLIEEIVALNMMPMRRVATEELAWGLPSELAHERFIG
ncbi:MAG: hypothetical protein Q8L27_04875 [archaeon]|nr:hypothetical protein [archaeon]